MGQAKQDPKLTDEVRDMQKAVFYQVMERRVLSSGAWVDSKTQTYYQHRTHRGAQERVGQRVGEKQSRSRMRSDGNHLGLGPDTVDGK